MRTVFQGTAMAALVLLLGPSGWAAEERDFMLRTTQDLADVCAVEPGSEMYAQAIHLCLGFLEATTQYHDALAAGESGESIVCWPDGAPTRMQAVEAFVDWTRRNPDHMDDAPIEGLMRAFVERFPCPDTM